MKHFQLLLVLSMLTATRLPAAVTLPSLFKDHLVLQRDLPVPVWGWAAPGDTITVSFAGQQQTATADAGGKWLVKLKPMPASAEPRDLIVQSKIENQNSKIADVLVGEVWLASGQSNMKFPLQKANGGPEAAAAADLPLVRLFFGNPAVAHSPARDVKGEWKVCTPATAKDFSAVAFFYGRELQQKLGVPVGLIMSAQDWTPGEAWLSREAMLAAPELQVIVKRWDEVDAEAEKAKAAGTKPKYDPEFIHRAAGLWNGGIAPLAPYAVRGVLWYQGETNDNRGHQYRTLFRALIRDWRKTWGQPDLWFLYVQLAAVLPPDPEPVESEWSEVREAQALALAEPETGMAVTIDIGDEKDVHPKNKLDVGHRLALVARSRIYGEKDLAWSGPVFKSLTIDGGQARLAFTHAAGGLATRNNEPLHGFAVAGADKKFVRAEAKIDGETVVVSSDKVPAPVAVRYAWANNPAGCNLVNKAGLPAGPFRTDDWPGKSAGVTKMFIDQ